MKFEYDTNKSSQNKEKHGIDFVEAQAIWHDVDFTETAARSETEPRFIVVGKIQGKHWSAFITYREHYIRIISVRRSRRKEIDIYESRRT